MTCYAIDGIGPVVDPTAHVHPSAVLIGDVIVGPGCYVGPCASLRADFGRIVLRQGANVQDSCVVHGFPFADTVVEEDGHIGHGAVLHACVVRRGALVGIHAVVMDEAEIGENSIVAAMAFVKAGAKIPPRSLAVGSPARVTRELSDEEIAWKTRGTGVYQRLALEAREKLAPCQPLAAPEPNRRRVRSPDYDPLVIARFKLGD